MNYNLSRIEKTIIITLLNNKIIELDNEIKIIKENENSIYNGLLKNYTEDIHSMNKLLLKLKD